MIFMMKLIETARVSLGTHHPLALSSAFPIPHIALFTDAILRTSKRFVGILSFETFQQQRKPNVVRLEMKCLSL